MCSVPPCVTSTISFFLEHTIRNTVIRGQQWFAEVEAQCELSYLDLLNCLNCLDRLDDPIINNLINQP